MAERYCFGVDIGGTTVKLGLFNTAGDVKYKWEIPTRKDEDGKFIIPDIAEAISKVIDEKKIDIKDVAGVGMGAPGPVDKQGVVNRCVNLGWGIKNIAKELEDLLKVPVKAGNDANVAALGEMWKGGGKGYDNIVLVTLGTGVGGGIIIDGEIMAGSAGAGGEIGHIHVEDDESESCGCGNKGCLEQYASATGLVRIANKQLKSKDKDSVLRNSEVTAKTVFDAVKAGDELAVEIAEEFGEYLGKGLAVVACVVNPEIFVIGGGVSKAGEILLTFIEKYYRKYVFHASREALFALATLGNDAGIYGAAKLVLDEAG
ncbi:MAG: ROK family glucokinase [Lachnospiraceae bacterium]|nr:ROK family glucokinase [Lachnospiraceae bacterium]